jgi:hypothetical protein
MKNISPRNRRVTTSAIRRENKIPGAYYHADVNPRFYYGWVQIRYGAGQMGYTQAWYPRFNFTTGQPEAVPF